MGAQLTQQQLASCCVAPDMTKIVHSHQDEKNQLLTTNVWLNLVSTVRNQMCLNDQHNWLTKENLFLFIFFGCTDQTTLWNSSLVFIIIFPKMDKFFSSLEKEKSNFLSSNFFALLQKMTKRQNTPRKEVFPKDKHF